MKKVGIVTLGGNFNYGNRLQNYALQNVLKEYGLKVETIVIKESYNNSVITINDIKNSILGFPYKVKELAKKSIFNYINVQAKKQREQRIKEFTKKYIIESDFSLSRKKIPKDKINEFDYFIAGSDQVWNPYYYKNHSTFFLQFASREKRVAYAPSFGVNSIPENKVENFKFWISEIEHLSVRENEGAEIIYKLNGKKVNVLVDPTLLLSKAEWMQIAKKPSTIPKKDYILTYFLGKRCDEWSNEIKKISKMYNMEVVNIFDEKDYRNYLVDPSEFIYYINSAKLVFTDSFHGTVFSILFNTPFIVFDRVINVSMNSRIITLLNLFGLENRSWENFCKQKDYFNFDISKVSLILEKEKRKAFDFLEKALKIENKKFNEL